MTVPLAVVSSSGGVHIEQWQLCAVIVKTCAVISCSASAQSGQVQFNTYGCAGGTVTKVVYDSVQCGASPATLP